jgi:hypothetical protein
LQLGGGAGGARPAWLWVGIAPEGKEEEKEDNDIVKIVHNEMSK